MYFSATSDLSTIQQKGCWIPQYYKDLTSCLIFIFKCLPSSFLPEKWHPKLNACQVFSMVSDNHCSRKSREGYLQAPGRLKERKVALQRSVVAAQMWAALSVVAGVTHRWQGNTWLQPRCPRALCYQWGTGCAPGFLAPMGHAGLNWCSILSGPWTLSDNSIDWHMCDSYAIMRGTLLYFSLMVFLKGECYRCCKQTRSYCRAVWVGLLQESWWAVVCSLPGCRELLASWKEFTGKKEKWWGAWKFGEIGMFNVSE